MLIRIVTLFPEVFKSVFSSSIIARAQKFNKITIEYINMRNFATDKYKSVDDKPYGGGVGMIIRVDIIDKAIIFAKNNIPANIKSIKTILLDPKGKQLTQKKVTELVKLDMLILICGRYEGFDERVSYFIDEKISVGNYILSGGEIPAMVVVDSVARLVKGVLSKKEAVENESFSLLQKYEPHQYTRPQIYKTLRVPKVLLSGDHQKIRLWKIHQADKLQTK